MIDLLYKIALSNEQSSSASFAQTEQPSVQYRPLRSQSGRKTSNFGLIIGARQIRCNCVTFGREVQSALVRLPMMHIVISFCVSRWRASTLFILRQRSPSFRQVYQAHEQLDSDEWRTIIIQTTNRRGRFLHLAWISRCVFTVDPRSSSSS